MGLKPNLNLRSEVIPEMTRVREFNDGGIEKFRLYLIAINENGESETTLEDLLSDETYSKNHINKIEVEPKNFSTKFAIAEYLHEKVSEISPNKKYRNTGMWTWLAAFYFDVLCPEDKNGTRKIGAESRYILNGDEWDRIFRHLLAGPVMIYDLHHANSIILLYNPADETGDFLAQLMGRQEIGTNRAVIEAAKTLYWDDDKKRPKRGSSPQEHKPGTLRRFVDVLQQFDLTYDLYSISGEELIRLLPAEFDILENSIKRKTDNNPERQIVKRPSVIQRKQPRTIITEEPSQHIQNVQDQAIPEHDKELIIEKEIKSEFIPGEAAVTKPVRIKEINSLMKVAMKNAMQQPKSSLMVKTKPPVIEHAARIPDEMKEDDAGNSPILVKTNDNSVDNPKVETPLFCRNCGKKVPPTAEFCPMCGKKLKL
jgi:hypothetical protein